MKIKNNGSIDILYSIIDTIISNKEYLSEIDGAIGDGDHGINMAKGFKMAGEKIKKENITRLSGGLQTLGEVLVMDIGGSMGPLYGTLFMAMGEACEDEDEIDASVFATILNTSKQELSDISGAHVGDKTIWDCLDPAINAYNQALEDGKCFVDSLKNFKQAAYEGWQSTKDLVAKIGRASRLGERSRGVLDAGATSCYLILACLTDEFINKIET